MRTIGRRWPTSAPRGAHQQICSYCGIPHISSVMRRDGSGQWACPDDYGRDVVTLAKGNARAAKALARRRVYKPQGIFYDGLVVEPEDADDTVTYDDPSVRFGNRLVGWWKPLTEHVQLSGGGIVELRDLSDAATALTPEFLFSPYNTVVTDAELDLEVMSCTGVFALRGSLSLGRPVPVSWWVTMKASAAQSVGNQAYSATRDSSELSSLRVSLSGVSVRPLSTSSATPDIPVTLDSWHVYGVEWLTTGRFRLTLDGVELAGMSSPALSRTATTFQLVTSNWTGLYIAEASLVTGTISPDEAMAQAGYMMQYAGL